MTDAAQVLDALHSDAAALDTLSKRIYEATDEYDKACALWDAHFDAVMATLEEEFGAAGRKSVPEHTAVSAARRENRALWNRHKSAKRTLERLEKQLAAKRAAISGRQSELGALREELRADSYGQPQEQPVFGGRRVA